MTPEETVQGQGNGLGVEAPDLNDGIGTERRKLATSILDLEPRTIWELVSDISAIPRDSYNEAGVRSYLTDLAADQGWQVRQDSAGNVVLVVPGKGRGEGLSPVVLQAHMDMVCEKDPGIEHDFTKDPIKLHVGWQNSDSDDVEEIVAAQGTTAGLDNLLGLANNVAIALDETIEHRPPLEILCTIAEEVGLDGARKLDPEIVKGRLILNLDTEDWGQIFISSAGGRDLFSQWNGDRVSRPDGYEPFQLQLTGLPGGHSGVEIHEGRPNAIHTLCAAISHPENRVGDCFLSLLEGGDKLNAIPSVARCVIWLPSDSYQEVITRISRAINQAVPGAALNVTTLRVQETQEPFSPAFSEKILDSILSVNHGVLKMSADVSGLVQTSNNVAKVVTTDDGVKLICKSRSSVDSDVENFQDKIRENLEAGGAQVNFGESYSGWKADPESELLKVTREAFKKVTGKDPEVLAVHAGLECGEFMKKLPGAQIVSYGPTIKDAHTPREHAFVSTVAPCYEVTKTIIQDLVPA